jgi:hypothetical protein
VVLARVIVEHSLTSQYSTRVAHRPALAPVTNRHSIGGKETLGGLERWFSPRGQDMAFLLSRIGLVRPRSEMIKIKSNQN